jgi:membrane fusion protein (multidrug efflux system)
MKLKPFLIALAIVLVLAGAVAGIKALQIGALIASGENEQAPVETVSTAAAEAQRWERSVESVGSLRAVQGADLGTEESGVVAAIRFENGQEVKEGDLLV